ncbi:MAG: ACT domain-containing protein [Candidatus Thorarchaeota archaeon]|jgi:hypothetical protein
MIEEFHTLERNVVTTNLTIILEDRPGTLAEVGEALGKAGVNIDGHCAFPSEGVGILHVLVEDSATARKAVEQAGFEVRDERPVYVFELEDKPGKLGEVARSIAEAGVNLDLVYLATNSRIVIGADNLDKARAAIEDDD